MGSYATLAPGLGAAALLAAMSFNSPGSAQQSIVLTQPVTPPPLAEQTTSGPPNSALLGGGIIALAGAYVPSVIIAAVNDNRFDSYLYIPVAGPWIDLGNRPPCGGLGQTSCATEDGYKKLLIFDGAVQGLGAAAVVLGLVLPQKRTTLVTAKADKPSLRVLPARVSRDAYGVAAIGKF